MNEKAVNFGAQQRLKGVLTLPGQADQQDLALILVSAGFTAKVGPHRLYAELARELARLGVPTLRFDLGGIGNSQTLNPGKSLAARTIDDIRAAADYLLQEPGVSHLAVGGLCSGAEDALRFAGQDQRISKVVMIDPHAYRTAGWYVRRVLSRHFFNRVVVKLLRTFRLMRIPSSAKTDVGADGLESKLIDYHFMPKEDASRLLYTLIMRSTTLHYVYTGGSEERFNHRQQFCRMFAKLDCSEHVTVDFVPHIEHVQIFEEDRHELVRLLAGRIARPV